MMDIIYKTLYFDTTQAYHVGDEIFYLSAGYVTNSLKDVPHLKLAGARVYKVPSAEEPELEFVVTEMSQGLRDLIHTEKLGLCKELEVIKAKLAAQNYLLSRENGTKIL
jgi:hypothetical protein